MRNSAKWILGGLGAIVLVGALVGVFLGGKFYGQEKELEESGWPAWVNVEVVETEWIGVGITITKSSKDGSVVVDAVLENSPAAGADLQVGDIILRINGKSTKELTVDQFKKIGRGGDEGTALALTVLQDVFAGPKEIVLVRAKIEAYPAKHSILNIGNYTAGYLQLPQYLTNNTPIEVGAALEEFRAKNIEVLVLDLRGTRGNIADFYSLMHWNSSNTPASIILRHFLKPENILYRWATPVQSGKAIVGPTREPFFEGKIIVVVDRETDFSAALIANSLKVYRNALVILSDNYGSWTKSFYGGSSSDYYRTKNLAGLHENSSIEIFVGKIYSPDGHKYQGWKADLVEGSIPPPYLLDFPEVADFLEGK